MARDPKQLLITDALVTFRIHHHDLAETTLDGYAVFICKYARWLDQQKALLEREREAAVAQGVTKIEQPNRDAVVANVELGLVNAWIADLAKATSPQTGKPYSDSTQLQAWAALRKFAAFAAEEFKHFGPEGGSALERLRMPSVGDDRRRELSDGELLRVLEAAKAGPCGERNYAIVYADAALGLRRGELIGLRISQINWHQRYVLVRRWTTKGQWEERKVTMGPEVTKVLHRWIFDMREGDPLDEDGAVFLTDDAHEMTPSAINRMARNIKKSSGVSRYSLHLGRHTWATNFRRAGTGDLLDLQRQGGWRDRRSVERYVHDRPDEERRRAPSPMSVLHRARRGSSNKSPRGPAAAYSRRRVVS